MLQTQQLFAGDTGELVLIFSTCLPEVKPWRPLERVRFPSFHFKAEIHVKKRCLFKESRDVKAPPMHHTLSLCFFCWTQRRPSLGLPWFWFVLQGSNSSWKLGERGERQQLLKATSLSSWSSIKTSNVRNTITNQTHTWHEEMSYDF